MKNTKKIAQLVYSKWKFTNPYLADVVATTHFLVNHMESTNFIGNVPYNVLFFKKKSQDFLGNVRCLEEHVTFVMFDHLFPS